MPVGALGVDTRWVVMSPSSPFTAWLRSLPTAGWLTNAAGALLATNDALTTLLGADADPLACLTPHDQARLAAARRSAREEGGAHEGVYHFRLAGGAQATLCLSLRTLEWQAECAWLHVLRPVQDTLSGARYRALVDVVARAVWTTDPQGRVVEDLPSWRALTGQTWEEARGEGWLGAIHPLDRERTRHEWQRAVRRGGPYRSEHRVRHADGQYRLMQARGAPVVNAGGAVLEWVGLYEDIGAEREAQAALEEQAGRLRAQAELLALADETVIVRDPASVIVSWNDAAHAMYGFSRAQALGQVSHDLFQTVFPESREAVDDALRERGFWQGELRHRKADGTPIYVLSRQALQRERSGAPKAILEINWDITDRKNAEEDLRRLNETLESRVKERTGQLHAANEELEAFAYSVAHDLRAPLRAAQGFAQAVQEDYSEVLDDAGRDYTGRIVAAAERMDQLIQDLLAYSRLTRASLDLRPVDLNLKLRNVLRELPQEDAARVSVAGNLPTVLGHPAVLEQVLTNLVSNALKFVRSGVEARVHLWADEAPEGCARVWVADNGLGIESAHQERIFRVFERLHGQAEYPGTGIGLAIVKKGVERLGGRVGVESRPGEGSRFWFALPAAKSP